MRNKRMAGVGMLAALMMGLAGCSGDGCLESASNMPRATFYNSLGEAAQVINLTVRGIGAPGDSCIVEGDDVSEVYLPLRSNATTSQFELNYNTEGVMCDTITLNYNALPSFVNIECGAGYSFDITSVQTTHHVITSVEQDGMTLKINMR